MHVVVVESPAKAKTINKYLGSDYTVLASFGHVRDLPSKDGSVRPNEDFAMEYQTDPDSTKHVSAIVKAVKSADTLYLATDPDREGEAISWHVLNALKEKKALKDVNVQRITFNAITKASVTEAIANPRDLDMDLINAQQARRALDYLVGFTLSPILWRKLPGAKSAGRVQSVALRLVCEREAEIEAFVSQEYWSVDADFTTEAGETFTARLTHVDGKKLDKFDLKTEADAQKIVDMLSIAGFEVSSVDTKEARRNPAPPFTTSTLQQEAARKLHFNAKTTMQVAQRLYEGIDIGGETVGLITYMRTDGVSMAGEAIHEARQVIGADFGASYVPDSPRAYKSKAKNAQEAHEAIRPTALTRRPKDLAPYLDDMQLKLYTLIWKRAIASQMASARLEKASVDVGADGNRATLRATGSIVLFDGFLRVYTEGRDDLKKAAPDANDDNDDDRRLPNVKAGDAVNRLETRPNQHHTEPPPRFSEASLVKRMEELGIGRPSTYAAILSVLRDRGYVNMDRNRFIPSDVGRLVTTFLVHFFERYFDYDFTAQLEERLDDITDSRANWKQVLTDFWATFSRCDGGNLPSVKEAVDNIDQLIGKRGDVIDVIDEELGPHFFPANDDKDARACPSCGDGRLSIKFGRNGGFVGCSNYPDCRYTRPLEVLGDGDADGASDAFPRELGLDPETALVVSIKKGPYGIYTQLGDTEGGNKPKRVSIPKNMDPLTIELETALKLLTLPRSVGAHPETGKDIKAGIGRFGPYLLHESKYTSLKGDDDVLTIGLNRAVTVIAETAAKGNKRGGTELRDLGAHPDDEAPIKIMEGRYGPYVAHNKINATLPKGTEPGDVTVEQAVALLAAKAAKSPKKKAPAKKATATKKTTAAKKTTMAKKTSTAKKTTAAKKAPAKKADS